MTTKDIPTHFATTIITTTARIIDYRERRVRPTESDTIRVLVLPVLQALHQLQMGRSRMTCPKTRRSICL